VRELAPAFPAAAKAAAVQKSVSAADQNQAQPHESKGGEKFPRPDNAKSKCFLIFNFEL
jgi:hypothetical protein